VHLPDATVAGVDDPVIGDAFGMAFLAHHAGGDGRHVIERDDGMVEPLEVAGYFSSPEEWPDEELAVIERAPGPVLDVGAGAGRHSLALQARGIAVTALDPSPGAIEVCRQRGVRDVFCGTAHDLPDHPRFETFLLLGNNLGLVGSPAEAPGFLGRLRHLAAPGARLFGSCIDPYATDDPLHLAYHERNMSSGRPGGQVTIRVRYRNVATDWFDLWWMTPAELGTVAGRAGWRLREHGSSPLYYAMLEAV
jgi:SAM-dependent methyltransferase